MTTQDWINKFTTMSISTLADITPAEAKELAAHLKKLQVLERDNYFGMANATEVALGDNSR